MKASDLKLEELVEFSEGNINLHGRRLVLHDLHAFAQFRKDLLDMAGPDAARTILTRFGYFWGQGDAAAMKRVFEWESLEEWLRAGPRLHTIQGVVRAVVQALTLDEATGHFEMRMDWHNSGEAEEHLIEQGPSHEPVCWMMTGYASGYSSFCLNREVFFLEKKCAAQGSLICAALGKDRKSWGDEIKPHLKFFQAEGITGKIMDLTRKLHQQSRELARQRHLLKTIEPPATLRHVEVHSAAFRAVVELAARVAPYDSSILITGESGVGKEVLARYIHANSPRARKPFVAINCAALPETLLDSELFGHKAGAFTGAIKDRAGLFEEADGGTVFLDEIGDVSASLQMKLLRVLQEKEVMPVGESRTRKVDVRVIAATNKNLTEALADGSFREDLYYRLRVIEIDVPPLRQRTEDILHLTRYFVKEASRKLGIRNLRLDATCIDYLQSYSWPGNVRELENAIERAAVLSREGLIRPEHLPPSIIHPLPSHTQGVSAINRRLADVEADHIRAVMRLTGDNKTRTARVLGISQATLWRRLKKLNADS